METNLACTMRLCRNIAIIVASFQQKVISSLFSTMDVTENCRQTFSLMVLTVQGEGKFPTRSSPCAVLDFKG